MESILFSAALAAYLLSTVGFIASLLIKRVHVARVSTWIFVAGFFCHSAFFSVRAAQTGFSPVLTIYDFFSLFAWALSGAYLVFQLKTKTRVLGSLIAPSALILTILSSVKVGGPALVPNSLKGTLVTSHIILSVAGEVMFTLACLAGSMYLVQEGLLKRHLVNNYSRTLPPLHDLDRISHWCLLWGFPFLTLGVIAGSLWANTVWGSHWVWEPKQVWTLTAWVFYALLIHQRLAIGWTGRKSAVLSIVFFVILFAAFISVNFFSASVHSF